MEEKLNTSQDAANFIVPLTWSVVIFKLFFAGIYFFLFDATYVAVTLLVCCFLALITLWVFPEPNNHHRLKGNILVFLFYIVVSLSAFFTGGMEAPVAPWFAAIPLCSAIVLSKRDTLIWTGLILFSVLVFVTLSFQDYVFLNEVSEDKRYYLFSLSTTGLILTMLVIGIVTEYIRERLTREKAEHQQNAFGKSRLASLGELAAGVAHEINNPLAIINGRTSRILRAMNKRSQVIDQDKVRSDLESILITVERITKIINSLRKVSGKQGEKYDEEFPVASVVEDVINIVGEKLDSNGVVLEYNHLSIDKDLYIQGDFTQLSQVFINLFNNSLDAMSDLEKKWIKINSLEVDGKITLTFTDAGTGINEEVSEKIFDPFFTTKEVGKGTGIGLSLSHKIIKNHGGELSYDSTCDNTSFVIILPVKVKHQIKKIA